jgi:chromosome segregation ATPase
LQVAAARAREAELSEVRAAYAASEERANEVAQRLKVSASELRKSEAAARGAQREARAARQQAAHAESEAAALRAAAQAMDSKRGSAQVRPRIQHLRNATHE